jgi:hypothetical protein
MPSTTFWFSSKFTDVLTEILERYEQRETMDYAGLNGLTKRLAPLVSNGSLWD